MILDFFTPSWIIFHLSLRISLSFSRSVEDRSSLTVKGRNAARLLRMSTTTGHELKLTRIGRGLLLDTENLPSLRQVTIDDATMGLDVCDSVKRVVISLRSCSHLCLRGDQMAVQEHQTQQHSDYD